MKIKTYLFILFVITLLSLGVWLLILFNTDPLKADWLTIGVFFAGLFFWLMGILTFISFYLRIWLSNREIVFNFLPVSLRQAVLLSLTGVGLLFLQSLKVLTWWSAVMYTLVIVLIELFFRTKTV